MSSPRSFEVLYYRRSKKVHKNRGVAKMDGKLSVAPPPSCVVKLVSSSLEEEEGSGNESISKQKAAVILSGIHRDVSKRVFDESSSASSAVQVDDVLSVGQYECEIVSVLPDGNDPRPQINRPETSSTRMLVQRKRPLFPPSSDKKNRIMSAEILSGRASSDVISKRALPPSSGSHWQLHRRPPPQPKRTKSQDVVEEKDSDTYKESDKENPLPSPRARTTNLASMASQSRPLLHSRSDRKLPLTTGISCTQTTSSLQPRSSSLSAAANSNCSRSSTPSIFPSTSGLVVPPSIQKVLRPHQVQGVAFLWNCLTGASAELQQAARQAGVSGIVKGAILADQMGLGKTLMTIATVFGMHRRNKNERFIIVCPSSLVSNWAKEFDKWIGRASQPKRVVVRKGGDKGLQTLRAFCPVKPHQAEVLIISYDLFRLNAALLTEAKQIGLLVVDEGHRLKNSAGSLTLTALQQLCCGARLLITGTPIQNNLTEFHTVANFVCPGLLGDLASFRREYERPLAVANTKNASWEQRVCGHGKSQALDSITKTFMLRRLQKDVLKSILPPRHEFLLFCRPSQQQCNLYRTIASRGMHSATQGAGASTEALTVLTNLRKLCCHPRLLENEPQGRGETVALEDSGKLQILCSLLEAMKAFCPNDKVVIVSNFTSALNVIQESILKTHHWPHLRLDGSTAQSDRQALVDSFNRSTPDKSFAFLLSSKAGGCGLNIIGANRLIMFDADYNPATDMQSMARIYRQGQQKSCYIYRLFTSGTVEEIVYQRQMQKGNLACITVDASSSMKNNSAGFNKEELRDCFTLKEGCACDTKLKVGERWREYGGADDPQLETIGDKPLLTVAREQANALSFVHVSEEQSGCAESDSDSALSLRENREYSSGDEERKSSNYKEESDSDEDRELEFEG